MNPLRRPLATTLLLGLLAAGAGRADQPVRIKLGTLAPQGSSWHTLLVEMGQKWKEASGGKVELKIYAGGTQGSEGEMIRKIGIGQLQAASVTAVGMKEITPEPQAEDVPFMIDSYAEYDYVHAKIRSELEAALAKKGFVVLNWGEVGFVHFFSTQAYKSPADYAQGKVFCWNGDPAAETAWKAGGFHPVVLSSTDLIPSLQSKMVNIVGEPPLYAFTAHLFEKANHMLDLNWGLLTGATVVRKEVWEKVPAELRPKLIEIAEQTGKTLTTDVRAQNDDALVQMKKHGLVLETPTDVAAWQKTADAMNKSIRGNVVPAGIYDEVKKLRDEYRAQHAR